MRPNSNQNNKNRQRSRNGGRKHVNPLSRNFESNGPDVKVRGNASHVAEKYLQLARDAQSSGDSVMAENYLQHAEHYFRIVSSAQQAQNGQRPDGDDADYDDDMPEMNSRFSSPQPQPQQQYGQQDSDEQGEGDQQPRQQQPQGEQRPRNERPEGERQQRNDRGERRERPDRSRPQPVEGEAIAAVPRPVVQSEEAAPAVDAAAEGEARKPRERRPRRRRPAGGDAGDLADADQPDVGELPAFLTAGTTSAAE